jgi:dTDP-4-dehydrorhamnose reductase
MKVLVLGSNGLIGYSTFSELSKDKNLEVYGAVKPASVQYIPKNYLQKIVKVSDYEDGSSLKSLFLDLLPNVVINCIGITKHNIGNYKIDKIVFINSLLPHKLQSLCSLINARLIHISTDCVFLGDKGNYSEDDLPDAIDIYGKTKSLGEVLGKNSLTIRTSTIGFELNTKHGLLEWFLNQKIECKGFNRAIFSGLPSRYLALILKDIIVNRQELSGLYHLASEPISKYSLLSIIKEYLKLDISIAKDETFIIDRSLNAFKYYTLTGTAPPNWHELIEIMVKLR